MCEHLSFVFDFRNIAVVVLPEDFSLEVVNIYPVVSKRRRAYLLLISVFNWQLFSTDSLYLPRWMNTEWIR